MLAMLSPRKWPTKVPNLKPLQLPPTPPLFAWACKRSVKMHSTESRSVIGPSSILFAGLYVCTFQPGNFTGWGSERVKNDSRWTLHHISFRFRDPLRPSHYEWSTATLHPISFRFHDPLRPSHYEWSTATLHPISFSVSWPTAAISLRMVDSNIAIPLHRWAARSSECPQCPVTGASGPGC